MHRRSFGFFATALILIPLLLVPVLATKGIPPLMPLLAEWARHYLETRPGAETQPGAQREQRAAAAETTETRGPDRQPRSPATAGTGDPFLQSGRLSRMSAGHTPPRSTGTGAASSRAALDGWRIQAAPPASRPQSESFGVQHAGYTQPAAQPQASARLAGEPLTWQSAVRRLNAMGIRQFNLQEGVREDEFHFSCFYTPPDNPRIRHRFEAEAREPLLAVEKVFTQIAEWQQFRQY